jgi:hypothetical protein
MPASKRRSSANQNAVRQRDQDRDHHDVGGEEKADEPAGLGYIRFQRAM